MFSTRPMTGRESFFAKERDLMVSFKAVVWGVVIRIEVGVVGRDGVGLKSGWR